VGVLITFSDSSSLPWRLPSYPTKTGIVHRIALYMEGFLKAANKVILGLHNLKKNEIAVVFLS
jgi:hypothetical protein